MIRMPALVACGTRTIIDATFGSTGIGETTYTRDLLRAMHPGMIVVADRDVASRSLIAAIAAIAAIVETGAEVLVRVKNGRTLPVCRRLRDGSYVSRIGPVEVQVICCEITIATSAGRRTGVYAERRGVRLAAPVVLAEQSDRLRVERDPAVLVSLGVLLPRLAVAPSDAARQRPAREVDVLPAQAAQLAAA